MKELNIQQDKKTGLYVWRNKNDNVIAYDICEFEAIDKYIWVRHSDSSRSLYTREGIVMPHAERVSRITDITPDSYTVWDSDLKSHEYTTPRGKLKIAGQITKGVAIVTGLAVLGCLITAKSKQYIENTNRLAEEEKAMLPMPVKFIKVDKSQNAYFDTDGDISTAEIKATVPYSKYESGAELMNFNLQAQGKTLTVAEWKNIGMRDFRKLNHENVRD